ncbi:MAG: GDP-L-fucose synthase family protein [Acidobacteriota bacterium]
MDRSSRIYVAGHRGLAGSALTRALASRGFSSVITRSHTELDLESQGKVEAFFKAERPEYVFLAAAKVGGILANNTWPVDFLLRNLKIQSHVIEASWRYGAKGLIFLASSCIYPKLAPQPLKEDYLLTGALEPTNEPYAVAKIAGITLCEAFNRQYSTRFLSVMPTNLYGPNDTYDLENSHVLPALIRKFHLARLASEGEWKRLSEDERRHGAIPADFYGCLRAISLSKGFNPPDRDGTGDAAPAVRLWGTGSPRREFLHSDDLADACLFLMERMGEVFSGSRGPSRRLINIGCGEDGTIRELAETVSRIVGFRGAVEWDASKPDGTPQKRLDMSRLSALGWEPRIALTEGIRSAYEDYLEGRVKS